MQYFQHLFPSWNRYIQIRWFFPQNGQINFEKSLFLFGLKRMVEIFSDWFVKFIFIEFTILLFLFQTTVSQQVEILSLSVIMKDKWKKICQFSAKHFRLIFDNSESECLFLIVEQVVYAWIRNLGKIIQQGAFIGRLIAQYIFYFC